METPPPPRKRTSSGQDDDRKGKRAMKQSSHDPQQQWSHSPQKQENCIGSHSLQQQQTSTYPVECGSHSLQQPQTSINPRQWSYNHLQQSQMFCQSPQQQSFHMVPNPLGQPTNRFLRSSPYYGALPVSQYLTSSQRFYSLQEAAKVIQSSSIQEGFLTFPDVKWEDVGGLDFLKKELQRYIIKPIKHPEIYEEFKVDLNMGFLLYGPPGCGKTLIAKAVANEAGINFIHIKGPDLLKMQAAESELTVQAIFKRARTCSPCILFFDEVDAITRIRGQRWSPVDLILTQLLVELDAVDKRKGVFVIGATNRPEVMDPAFKKRGRFGKHLHVPLPGPDERGFILKALARNRPVDKDVDLTAIGRKCGKLSGADLAEMLNDAAREAAEEKLKLGRNGSNMKTINPKHFERALEKISVSSKRLNYYI